MSVTRRTRPSPPPSHLKNDVLLQHQRSFQLRSDRNKTLHDLLDVLISVFTRVRKRNNGTIDGSKFPGCGREHGSLVLAQRRGRREEREYTESKNKTTMSSTE